MRKHWLLRNRIKGDIYSRAIYITSYWVWVNLSVMFNVCAKAALREKKKNIYTYHFLLKKI